MIWSVSWKNVWRNKVRSLVVIIAVTVGLTGGIFVCAVMNGATERRIDAAINYEASHIQLHHPRFGDNYEMKYYFENVNEVVKKIVTLPQVEGICLRTKMTAMANTAKTGTGVMIIGIDPKKEKTIFKLHTKLTDTTGSFFEKRGKNQILISKRMADKLNAKTRSRIVLTLQDSQGNLIGGSFRVVGIYSTNNSMFDEMNVFVRHEDICRLTAFEKNRAHEIIVRLGNTDDTGNMVKKIQEKLPETKVEGWYQILPELGWMGDYMNFMLYFLMIIILLALGFGIINTMLMVVLERVKELGMLMAIGMNKRKVFSMIMLESIFLSFTGGIVGIIVSYLLITLLSNTGIDLSHYADGFESIGFEAVIYPEISTVFYFVIASLVIVTGILASVYPAFKALRYNPADAIRIE